MRACCENGKNTKNNSNSKSSKIKMMKTRLDDKKRATTTEAKMTCDPTNSKSPFGESNSRKMR
jgi:hypothetical protein